MSTCVVVDTVDWVDATCVSVGDTGFGVLGSSVPSSGTNGPAYAYPYLNLATDAGKEVCGRITIWPTNGTLDPAEDTSFTYTPTADGTDSFSWQLYLDGVATGSPHVESLQSGTGAVTATGATLTGSSSIVGGSVSGTTGSGGAVVNGASLNSVGSIVGGSATGATIVSTPGASLNGSGSIAGGTATGIVIPADYTRAPVGPGYCGQVPVDPHTIRLIGEPAAAVSLDAALTAARVDADAGLDDDVLNAAVAYTEEAEGITQRAFVQQTWRATWTEFPSALKLPRPPLISVTHVKFYDDAGIQRTLDPQDYVIDADSEPAYIVPAPGRGWPVTSTRIHAVEVQYDCGYGATEAAVPKAIKQFVMAKLQQQFSPVATASTINFDGLLDRYKVYS